MKKIMVLSCLLIAFIGLPVPKASAQATEVAQLLLNIEKLRQFREILKQMKQGYDILTGGYNTVINIAQGNFKIHKAFLDGLLAVSPAVKNYQRVAGIIDYQIMLVRESRAAMSRLRQDGSFSDQELAYIEGVYDNLLKQSLRNLDELTEVITAGKLRMSDVLRILFEAAALCINTLRTFQMIVLAILGPLVFGIAVFDGFQHTLTVWIARYINVFLWLPVANIFGGIIGKIQENMLKVDISQINQTGETFFSRTDAGYLVFLIIGIVGYFTVPSVANYIVHAGGGGALTHRVTSIFGSSSRSVVSTTAAGVGMAADAVVRGANVIYNSMAGSGQSDPYFPNSSGSSSAHMKDRLKGNS